MKNLRYGNYVIPLWLIATLLTSGTCSVLAYYLWTTLTIPFRVKEPIEIVQYPSVLDLFPGESSEFDIVLQNHASLCYSIKLTYYLDNETYQNKYVQFSDTIYVVEPGAHNLTGWLKVDPDAPATAVSLAIHFERGVWRLEDLGITSVLFPSSSQINITISNFGEEASSITSIWVNTTKTWDGEVELEPGVKQAFMLNYSWAFNKRYIFRVITSLGNEFSLSFLQLEENLSTYKLHTWHNGSTFSESAFLVINTGSSEISFEKFSVRGQECSWNTIYYNKTWDPIYYDLPYLLPNINGTLLGVHANIGVQNYSLIQASGELFLAPGHGMIVYVTNPDSISVNDIGVTIGVTIFTSRAQYYKECNVQAAN